MVDELDIAIQERNKQAEYDALPIITYQELEAVINKWMLVIDPGVVKLLAATIIANRINSDPVWLYLLAPSGGGKTELMSGLLKCPEYYPLSQLTPNTFLSGYKSKTKEASLLKRLKYGTTIGFKDFTSILDGNADAMKEIMGQLRDIYDGSLVKVTGTGDEIKWQGKIGFIAGCTPMLEQRMTHTGAMGERFLNYRMKNPVRKDLRAKMRQNIGKEAQMRDEIQNAYAGYLKGVVVPQELPAVSQIVDGVLESMSDFIAISRAVVIRGYDTKKEIEYLAEPEMSSRTYKQLYNYALSLYIMNKGEWNDTDNYIIRNLAVSSIHSIRFNIIRRMTAYKTQVKTTTMAMELGYPTTTTRRYLEDLAAISMDDGAIKIITRTHQGAGKPDLWEITPAMKEILTLMGENMQPTKEDTRLQDAEEEIPVGSVTGNGKYHPLDDTGYQQEVEDITADMTEEEKITLGL